MRASDDEPRLRARRKSVAAPATGVEDLGPTASRVLGRFRQIFNTVKTQFQQMERSAGIGGAQLWALSVIRDRPGIGINELAQALGIRQSTASNLVKSLVQRGLVATQRHAGDRRAVQLAILAQGRALLRRTPGPYSGVLVRAIAGMDARALARLDRELAGLIDALGADESAASIPLAQILTAPPRRRGRGATARDAQLDG